MSFIFALVFLSQYTDVYVPQKPFYVESGCLGTVGIIETGITARFNQGNDKFSVPVLSSICSSFDGFNEFGLELPWVKAAKTDTSNRIAIGNLGITYKRRIIASQKYGYLAAGAKIELATSPDTFGIRDSLGGNKSRLGIGLSYTYEYPLIADYHTLFGRLPIQATITINNNFLSLDNDSKELEFNAAGNFAWGASAQIIPFDFAFAGASLIGNSRGIDFIPYAGISWFWFEAGVAYHTLGENRIDAFLRFYM